MEYIISFLIGILIGSVPTAYILLKITKGIDITKSGSGNVGAMNSYRISDSVFLAIVIFIIDFIKGLAAVELIALIYGNFFPFLLLGLIGSVLGHCYSFWIKFRGGRGLATAFGGAVLISIPLVIIWVVMWLIGYAFRRNIHFSNFIATLLTAVLSFTSVDVLNRMSQIQAENNLEFSILVSIVLIIILIRHIEPIKLYIKQQADKSRNVSDE